MHYLLQNTGNFPSGESLKETETRFLAKVRDRQDAFGQVWADAVSFALTIDGRDGDIRLITEWEDPAPMGEREFLENILLRKHRHTRRTGSVRGGLWRSRRAKDEV